MPPDQVPSPTRRADAERNRDKILAAARSAFADPEAEVSMAEVSRRAGVGMATLYRNFPGRRELLADLYTDEVNAICKAAAPLKDESPGAALVTWLHQFFAFVTSKRHIGAELLVEHTNRTDPLFHNNRARVISAARPLLATAQRAHEVRDDLALEQILDMVIAVATIRGDSDYVQPILQTVLDGLRVRPESAPEARRP